MQFHEMEIPRKVLLGSHILEKVKEVCKELNLKDQLVINDNLTKNIAGESVSDCLKCENIIVKNAEYEEVKRVIEIVKENKHRSIIAVGGGSVIDIGKLASYSERIPFISVPTTSSHDGIASSRASIVKDGRKTSLEAHTPIAVIADISIIVNAPYRFLAAGCGDLIANYTAVKDWQLAHRLRNEYYSEYAASLSLMSAKLMIENAEVIKNGLEESVRKVVKGLISSGVAMSIAGSSRPASGSEHMFSHALDRVAEKPALHGEQCGVGSIMMMYLHGGNWREIRDALKTVKAPVNAKELGVTEEEIIKALMIAPTIRKRYTILGEKELSRDVAYNIAKRTGVI
ncbi:MAG: NAD(P)-dependent glycerol-1-phosphate dehydrogenase [Methanomicrobia archaeon]|nr:NAD(P)-dependent glycerol-1-phosphate dehydrogenase [Methanomicrobia archaeon]